MSARVSLVLIAFALAAASCSCDTRASRRSPTLHVVNADGTTRSSVDFGQVQLGSTGTQKVTLRNEGSAPLNVFSAELASPLFAITDTLPLVVDVGVDVDVTFTFKPTTADQRVVSTVSLSTDDPAARTATIGLAGTGVTAVAVLTPKTVAFGDVYLTEKKSITVTLTNSGSNDLTVTNAYFTTAVPQAVTANFSTITKTLKAGEAASVVMTFAPTAEVDFTGSMQVVFGGDLGTTSVPVSGRGVQAVPRLCFQLEGSGLESCTGGTTTSLTVNFGKFCDARLFPPDGGQSGCFLLDGGTLGYGHAGQLRFRNEGNTPVAYSVHYDARRGPGCDAGTTVDFLFSNAPDGGARSAWDEATVSLPSTPTAAKPWETLPIRVDFQPRSHCTADGSDSAQVIWTRQSEPLGRLLMPSTLLLLLSGGSALPKGAPQDITFTGAPPLSADVVGVNKGDAPLTFTKVELWQGALTTLSDGGTGRGSTPGELCTPASTDACAVFAWAPGQSPSGTVPVTLPGTGDPQFPATRPLGHLVFGPDGGVAPQLGREYTVFAVISTSDSYNPPVVSTIKGTAR